MAEFDARFTKLCGRVHEAVGHLEYGETDASVLAFERRLERLRGLKLRIPLPSIQFSEAPKPEVVEEEEPPSVDEGPPPKPLKRIFAPRKRWATSKKLVDGEQLLYAAFSFDWQRACSTKGFVTLIVKADDDAGASAASSEAELAEVKQALWKRHQLLFSMFDYYAALGTSDDMCSLGFNAFKQWVNDCGFVIDGSRSCDDSHVRRPRDSLRARGVPMCLERGRDQEEKGESGAWPCVVLGAQS